MIYLGLSAVILLHLFTVSQTFIIGWGYSSTGFKSIQDLFTKAFDHTPWNTERGVVVPLSIVCTLLGAEAGSLLNAAVVAGINTASWLLCFPFLQQLSHNTTLKIFKVKGYGININESPNGTARIQSKSWVKIICFCLGILTPIAYTLI